jgi:hypothetical protein
MSFGEVEEDSRIAAGGNDPPGRGISLEPMFSEKLLPRDALHPILSNQDHACSAVGIEQRWRGSQLFELASGFLAARAIAGTRQNRPPDRLKFYLAAVASRGKMLVKILVHDGFRFAGFYSPTSLAGTPDVCNGSMQPAIQAGVFAISFANV